MRNHLKGYKLTPFGYSIIAPPMEHRWYLLPGMLLLLVFCLLAWGEVLADAGPRMRAAFTAASGVLVAAGLSLIFGVTRIPAQS